LKFKTRFLLILLIDCWRFLLGVMAFFRSYRNQCANVSSSHVSSESSTSETCEATPVESIVSGKNLASTYHYQFQKGLSTTNQTLFKQAIAAYNQTGIVKLIAGTSKTGNTLTFRQLFKADA
jgi:hypothetical protein